MSARKKSTAPPRQHKAAPPPPPPAAIDLDALLTIGEERVHIDGEDDDNAAFMAEPID